MKSLILGDSMASHGASLPALAVSVVFTKIVLFPAVGLSLATL